MDYLTAVAVGGVVFLVILYVLLRVFNRGKDIRWGGAVGHGISLALLTLFVPRLTQPLLASLPFRSQLGEIAVPMIIGFLAGEVVNSYLPSWKPSTK